LGDGGAARTCGDGAEGLKRDIGAHRALLE